ncbi:hypothetical protein BaRGS_00020793 [Batillaria attramentaria]|uniref:Uncharacterized protein n=1 Tax=Batillaria attramentaria TaxID=370345 RepID=A0ABD0KLA2_9CAEN
MENNSQLTSLDSSCNRPQNNSQGSVNGKPKRHSKAYFEAKGKNKKDRVSVQEEPTPKRRGKGSSKGGRFKSAPGRQRTSSLLSTSAAAQENDVSRPSTGLSAASSVSVDPSNGHHNCYKVSHLLHYGLQRGGGVVLVNG